MLYEYKTDVLKCGGSAFEAFGPDVGGRICLVAISLIGILLTVGMAKSEWSLHLHHIHTSCDASPQKDRKTYRLKGPHRFLYRSLHHSAIE